MKQRFVSVIERFNGCKVSGFICTHHIGPDLEIELFVLEPARFDGAAPLH